MSTLNKVLLVLVFLCAAGFVYLGANALKMRRDSQKKLADAYKTLEAEKSKNREYLYGSGQNDGYVFLRDDVNRLRKIRGIRAWSGCTPESPAVEKDRVVTFQLRVDATPEKPIASGTDEAELSPLDQENGINTGVATAAPPQDHILPGTVVYLFDNRSIDEGGCLLGEFTVDRVENNIATLKNVYLMTQGEIQRINDSVKSLAPWSVYTVLPGTIPAETTANNADRDLPEGEEAAVGSFAETNTVDRSLLGQTYVSLNLKRMHLMKYVDIYDKQKSSLLDADTTMKQELVSFYDKEKAETQDRLNTTKGQTGVVNQLMAETSAEINNLEVMIANVKALNKKMLADLTKAQLTASEKINERDASLSMAQ